MRRSTSNSLQQNSFLSADDEMSTPDASNPYLQAIFMPELYGNVAIPDDDPTPNILKTIPSEMIENWVASDAVVLGIWTPNSPSKTMRFWVARSGQPWAYLGDLEPSQPLYQQYDRARLVSGTVRARSAAQAAGVFQLSGEISAVYVNRPIPFSQLTYNSLLSWAPNSGMIKKSVPVQRGFRAIYNPAGDREFWTPENDQRYDFKELFESTLYTDEPSSGWAPAGVIVLPIGGQATIWDSVGALTAQGNPALPDPFYGNMAFLYELYFFADGQTGVWVEVDYYVRDPLTWNSTLVTVTVAGSHTIHPPEVSDYQNFASTGVVDIPQNVVAVRLILNNNTLAPINVTFAHLFRSLMVVTSYDSYRPNVQGPAVYFMANKLTAGQPISIDLVGNYELVPGPSLARNIDCHTDRGDVLMLEGASAVLSQVGRGVALLYDEIDYQGMIKNSTFNQMATGRTIYHAANMSLKSKLLDIWRKVNPHLTAAGLSAGKAGLKGLLGALTVSQPELAPLAIAFEHAYLSADPQDHLGGVFEILPDLSKEEGKEEECSTSLTCAEDKTNTYHAADSPSPSSDFVNIVNGKSAPLSRPRMAYFPVVPDPENVSGETRAFRIIFSSTPLPGKEDEYDVEAFEPHTLASIRANAFFATEHKINFLHWLGGYGVQTSILSPRKTCFIYADMPPEVTLKGNSWQLAAVVALLGIAGNAIYSGTIEYAMDPLCPLVGGVGECKAKAEFAKRLGVLLVTSANITEAQKDAVNEIGDIIYPGFLCSGFPIPPKVVACLIATPSEVVILSMRVLKHRVTMSPQEQQEVSGVAYKTPKEKERKVQVNIVPQEVLERKAAKARILEAAKRSAMENIIPRTQTLTSAIKNQKLAESEFGRSVPKKIDGWFQNIEQAGTPEAVNLQLKNILTAIDRQYQLLDKVRVASTPNPEYQGMTKSQKSRAKLKAKNPVERSKARPADVLAEKLLGIEEPEYEVVEEEEPEEEAGYSII